MSKALKNRKILKAKLLKRKLQSRSPKHLSLGMIVGRKEKSFKTLEKDFVDSWTEVLELKDTMARKTSEFESSNAKKDNHISPLEAKLKRANKEHKAEVPR